MALNPKEIALKFVECINQQDLEGLFALMTAEHTFIGNEIGDVTKGREKVIDGFTSYFSDFPEYSIHISNVTRSGNDIAIIGRTTGSHITTDIEDKETVIWIAKIEDDKVAEWRIYTDLYELMD